MRTNRDDIRRMTRSSAGVGSGGTGGGAPYTLPLAADGTRGGVQIGYTTSASARKYAVQLEDEKMYVNVPWTDHYAWSDITSKPATATRWPTWSEVTSKPTSKTAWGKTYLNASSEFQNISGDLSAGNSGGTISQFHSIELNSAGSLSGYGGFIDFHFNGSSADYTSRIIEDAIGKLNINQAVFVNYNGNVGIGTTSPSYKLHVAGSIYATGGFTFLSDIRKKNVIDYQQKLTAEDIANAPLIHYTLKDDPEQRVQVGSVAQYWKKKLPETVLEDKEGTLSMQYDVQAHTAAVVLARKVVELQKEIYELKALIKNGK